MTRYLSSVAALLVTLTLCSPATVVAQAHYLTPAEAGALEFTLLFSELKREYFETGGEQWANPSLLEFANEEEHHMDYLENLATKYDVEISIYYWGCNEIFWDYEELDFYCGYVQTEIRWWDNWEDYILTAAYFEELGIRELKEAIKLTEKQLLVDTYTEMLGVAYVHLLHFVSILHDDPYNYEAQLIDQSEIDLALAAAMEIAGEGFEINTGLNDAWYEPATDGQGFFIMVYPEKGTVFVGWFTFDMDFPSQDVIAGLGDACQRWLTAQGSYEGNQADLVVYNSSGGLFDSVLAVPQLEPIGSITLQFENCEAGTVSYDLPSYGLMGEIPIQRVASDNVTACQIQSYLSH